MFLIGRELFRFAAQKLADMQMDRPIGEGTVVMRGAPSLQAGPTTAKLEHIQLNGEVTKVYDLDKSETTIGRTTGDLVFANDPYMSGRHAQIIVQPGRFILKI